jgi:thiamine biosynthesis lipoprotein
MTDNKLHIRLMGSDFELIGTEERLEQGVTEIKRIEALLTEFNDTSVTAQLNANAGLQPVTVPAEVYQLIQRCLRLSAITQGAFDISSGLLKRLFNFKQHNFQWPQSSAIADALQKTGYRYITLLDNNRILLGQKGMRIGFGAIGKGYAADKVKALWIAAGADSGVINASGDLTAWGSEPWKVGIANPDDPEKMLMWLPVYNASVATSGNYEQYIERNGIRYSHNIDPRTGKPVPYIKSVTVISPSAELSDALATAVTVMGPSVGLDFINQLPDVHCIIIDSKNKIFQSEKIQIHAKG